MPVISPASRSPEAICVGAGVDMDTSPYDGGPHIARRGFGKFHHVSRPSGTF
ncbi:hypothetical protein BN903_22 [Halorubrum sp. AJ67]|nr:hypothetical protein BN903_22 [Halorubrum sp. AJ67]